MKIFSKEKESPRPTTRPATLLKKGSHRRIFPVSFGIISEQPIYTTLRISALSRFLVVLETGGLSYY